jgi:hypothetical protein
MLPIALIFHARARSAGFVKLSTPSLVKEHILALLNENNNPVGDDGKFSKITLAVGA